MEKLDSITALAAPPDAVDTHGSGALYGVLVACLLLSVPFIFLTPMRGDEVMYHLPLAVAFSRGFPVFEWGYTSAYTPLPYIAVGGLFRLFGEHVQLARLANLAVGVTGIVAFYRLVRLVRPAAAPWGAAFVGFAPYYLRDCSVFYVGSWTIAFSLLGLYFYVRRRGWRDVFAASLSLGAATLSGQWALIVVIAVVASEIISTLGDDWRRLPGRARDALATVGVILAFQVPVAIVFIGWGGLTPLMFRRYALAVTPPHAVGALAVIGFTFAWWIVSRLKHLTPYQLAAVATAFPLFLLALPEVSVYQGAERFAGLTARILGGASSKTGLPAAVLLAPAAFLGLAGVVLLLKGAAGRWSALSLAVLVSLVAFSSSVQLAESHTRLVVVLAFLLAMVGNPMGLAMKLVVFQSSALGLLYTVYHAFVKPF